MLTASPELARSALDAAPDAMIIIDGAGVIRFANRQVSSLFGYAHDDIIGKSVEQLMPERFRDRHVVHRLDYFIALRQRPMGKGLALFGLRRDGSEFPVEISLSPLQTSSTAQTLTSTNPSGSASERTTSSVMSVGTLAAFFGQDTQIMPSSTILCR